jgi:serine/threonine protein kinase
MAPEIVRGEALPSTQTDLFSLAVLLFLMLVNHHPLEGRREADIHCFDLPAMTKLYGTEPLFIFDPLDHSNEPLRGYHDNALAFWPVYPTFLRELFTRAFTDGLRDPEHGRIRETTWRAAMSRLRDSILYCRCGAENFYDAEALRSADGTPGPCWKCRQPLQLPPRIRIGKAVVMLNHDTQLFPHHLDGRVAHAFSEPFAEVSRHPMDPNVWGLKNLSPDRWTVTSPDGSVLDIDKGQSLPLGVGTRVHFGRAEGEIRL